MTQRDFQVTGLHSLLHCLTLVAVTTSNSNTCCYCSQNHSHTEEARPHARDCDQSFRVGLIDWLVTGAQHSRPTSMSVQTLPQLSTSHSNLPSLLNKILKHLNFSTWVSNLSVTQSEQSTCSLLRTMTSDLEVLITLQTVEVLVEGQSLMQPTRPHPHKTETEAGLRFPFKHVFTWFTNTQVVLFCCFLQFKLWKLLTHSIKHKYTMVAWQHAVRQNKIKLKHRSINHLAGCMLYQVPTSTI